MDFYVFLCLYCVVFFLLSNHLFLRFFTPKFNIKVFFLLTVLTLMWGQREMLAETEETLCLPG